MEEDFLRNNYTKLGIKGCAIKTHRSLGDVKRKANELGLDKEEDLLRHSKIKKDNKNYMQ